MREAASGPIGKELFEKEQEDLLTDLKDIPKKACDRRVSDFYHIYKEFCFLELVTLIILQFIDKCNTFYDI